MTDQLERTAPEPATDSHDAVIAEAIAVIDQALGRMMRRELVSSNEVADLLLDVRTTLTAPVVDTSDL
ncbi:MAG: hypothetical protein H0U21_01630 [Acidimicrobiia bacterium]|nr:hypothetical protein [Acidimicrobiia bacterium]